VQAAWQVVLRSRESSLKVSRDWVDVMSLDALKLHERKFHTRSQALLVPWTDIFLTARMSAAK